MDDLFLICIEVVGTIAFAISGIRLAAARHFDWFGAYIIGLVTAIGGGTLRDVLLDIPVFWMQTPLYLLVTGISLTVTIVFRRTLIGFNRSLFVFDAIGLALFVVIGIQKSLLMGYPFWVAISMGMITGSFGGVIRDILINIEPLFFRKDIYATACIAGGLVYWFLWLAGCSDMIQQAGCAVTVVGLRMCAIHFNWSLPILNYQYKKSDNVNETNGTE